MLYTKFNTVQRLLPPKIHLIIEIQNFQYHIASFIEISYNEI